MHIKQHKFLTLKEKYEVLENLQKGSSVTNLAKKYGVTKSRVSIIKKNKNAISKCVNNTFIGPGKRKTMRPSEYPKIEKSLYKWFMRMAQTMDQNAIRITKLYYRNSVLASIIAKGGGLIESIKQTTLKEAIIILESAWRRVDSAVLSKCWNNILNRAVNQDDPEEEIPLSVVRENLQMNLRELEESAANVLCALLPEVQYTASNVKEWNEDAFECEDNEVEAISDEDDCVEEPKRTIKDGRRSIFSIRL